MTDKDDDAENVEDAIESMRDELIKLTDPLDDDRTTCMELVSSGLMTRGEFEIARALRNSTRAQIFTANILLGMWETLLNVVVEDEGSEVS